ncbi:MAG: DUF2281 domain-containing protein [Anaerolineae bacterium]|nr:DUF2281 domain-containing protein [Anaerolineae bacterium]
MTTRVIAALEQLPQAQAIEALHYVEYLLDKYATAKKPRKRQPTKREDNPFLKMAGIASFEPYPDVQSLDKELYGL